MFIYICVCAYVYTYISYHIIDIVLHDMLPSPHTAPVEMLAARVSNPAAVLAQKVPLFFQDK